MAPKEESGREKEQQLELFAQEQVVDSESTDQSVYVLSSNWSIGALLARGCLLPPAYGEPTRVAFFDEDHPDHLLVAVGSIPEKWCQSLLLSLPTGKRDSSDDESEAEGTDEEKKESLSIQNILPIAVRVSENASVEDSERVAQFRNGVALDEVDAFIFSNEEERDRFRSLKFSDFDLESIGVPLEIDPDVFAGGDEPSDGDSIDDEKSNDSVEAKNAQAGSGGPSEAGAGEDAAPKKETRILELRSADARAALRTVLLTESPGEIDWVDACFLTWGKETGASTKVAGWVEAILRGLQPGKSEKEETLELAVLSASSYLLWNEFDLNSGWAPSEALAKIVKETERRCSKNALAEEGTILEKWAERSRAVIEARKEPPEFLDKGRICLRTVLFLLLRGDLGSILETDIDEDAEVALRAGVAVRTLSACLAAIGTGLRGLPKELKVREEARNPRSWLELLGRGILEELGIRSGKTRDLSKSLEKEYREQGTLQGEWIFRCKGERLYRKTREFDPRLVELEARGRSLGYEFNADGESGLQTAYSCPDGSFQEVYLSLEAGSKKADSVRFWAPVMDLSSSRTKGEARWPTAALNKLPKGFLIDLLERNARFDVNCRFAISREKEKLFVLVDQLLDTMDKPEFRQHLEHVAQIAHAFNKAAT